VVLLFSGCGLRVEAPLRFGPEDPTLAVRSEGDERRIARTLERRLERAGATLVDPGAATLRIVLEDETLSRRIHALNAAGAVGEYRLTLSVRARFQHGAYTRTRRLEASRNYVNEPDQPLLRTPEEADLRARLEDLIVARVLDQLRALLARSAEPRPPRTDG
jgi:outer membrane lipopolysaccharide assembly protein LptE/RlpB